ncbi:MAG: YqgE/AlgH family protein, partial [Actinomycetota bacterium]
MESLKGQLLVAAARIFDPNFRRVVVLVIEHDAEGAAGVVLNRSAEVPIADAVPVLSSLVGSTEPVFVGGPVQPDSIVILADLEGDSPRDLSRGVQPVFGSVVVLGDGWLDASPGEIRRARAFSGYSGWGPGQLESEIAGLDWIVEPAGVEDVFSQDPPGLWSEILRRK